MNPTLEHNAHKPSWADTLRVYLEPASLRMLALGFSAGLPLLLVFGTLSFRLREAGIDRATIGYLSWILLIYGFKWCWSPLVDRLPIPLLVRMGQRRSWLFASQMLIMAALVGLAICDPKTELQTVVWFALLAAFGSATQDIALDAFRIESAGTERQAALAGIYQSGYRLAMIWAGAGVLWIAARAEVSNAANYDHSAWQLAYLVMAASMMVGVVTVLFTREPAARSFAKARHAMDWLQQSLFDPFLDFFRRYGKRALLILALIATYRISDVVMGIMANPFYVDMGFTKIEVANVAKVYGLSMTIAGGLLGGALSIRFGMLRVLMLGGVLSAATNLLFVWLAGKGHDVTALIWVISADNLASGIASAAFIAYMSSLTNINYTATQYAVFSSIMLLLPKFIGGYSGAFVDAFGYANFFASTAIMGLPVLVLVAWVARTEWPQGQDSTQSPTQMPAPAPMQAQQKATTSTN